MGGQGANYEHLYTSDLVSTRVRTVALRAAVTAQGVVTVSPFWLLVFGLFGIWLISSGRVKALLDAVYSPVI